MNRMNTIHRRDSLLVNGDRVMLADAVHEPNQSEYSGYLFCDKNYLKDVNNIETNKRLRKVASITENYCKKP